MDWIEKEPATQALALSRLRHLRSSTGLVTCSAADLASPLIKTEPVLLIEGKRLAKAS